MRQLHGLFTLGRLYPANASHAKRIETHLAHHVVIDHSGSTLESNRAHSSGDS
jgi:hypothetical protein